MTIKFLKPEDKKAIKDAIFLSLVSFLIVGLAIKYDVLERLHMLSLQYHEWYWHEFLGLLTTMASVSLAIFAFRRWLDIKKLVVYADSDSLTGVFNRRKGVELIKSEIERIVRYSKKLSLIMFDIDHFKLVNDTHGHLKGDEVLRAVAAKSNSLIRATDFLVRWGGEEFLVICPETDLDGARELAERIRLKIKGIKNRELPGVTASFGVHEVSVGDDFHQTLKLLDEKLYRAKYSGRDSVVSH